MISSRYSLFRELYRANRDYATPYHPLPRAYRRAEVEVTYVGVVSLGSSMNETRLTIAGDRAAAAAAVVAAMSTLPTTLIRAAKIYRESRQRARMRGYREVLLTDTEVRHMRTISDDDLRQDLYRILQRNRRLQREVIHDAQIFRVRVMRELLLEGPPKTWIFSDPLRDIDCMCDEVEIAELYHLEERYAAIRQIEIDRSLAHSQESGQLGALFDGFLRKCRNTRDIATLLDHLASHYRSDSRWSEFVATPRYDRPAGELAALEHRYGKSFLNDSITREFADSDGHDGRGFRDAATDQTDDPRSPLERLLADVVRIYDLEIRDSVDNLNSSTLCERMIHHHGVYFAIDRCSCSAESSDFACVSVSDDDIAETRLQMRVRSGYIVTDVDCHECARGDYCAREHRASVRHAMRHVLSDELDTPSELADTFHLLRMPDFISTGSLELWRELPMRGFARLMRQIWCTLPPFNRIRYGDYNNLTLCNIVNCDRGWRNYGRADIVGREAEENAQREQRSLLGETIDDEWEDSDSTDASRFIEYEKRLAAKHDWVRPSLLPAIKAMRDYGDWNAVWVTIVLTARILADLDNFASLDATGEAKRRWSEWRILFSKAHDCNTMHILAILHVFRRCDELSETYATTPVYNNNLLRYMSEWTYIDCLRGGRVIANRDWYDVRTSFARVQFDLNVIVTRVGLDDAVVVDDADDDDADGDDENSDGNNETSRRCRSSGAAMTHAATVLGVVPSSREKEWISPPSSQPTRLGERRHCFTLRQQSMRQTFEIYALSDYTLLRFAPYREYARRLVMYARDYYVSNVLLLNGGGITCADMRIDVDREMVGYAFAVLDIAEAAAALRDNVENVEMPNECCWHPFLIDDTWRESEPL